MSKFSTKSVAALVAAIVLSLVSAAFAAGKPCVGISASLSSGAVSGQTITVSPGAPVTLTGIVSNCSTGTETVNITYDYQADTQTGTCDQTQTGSYKTKVGAGDAYTKVLNYTAPSCPGTYVVTLSATATAGSQTSTPVSVTLTVNVQ
jgi:hypothetical protein